LINECIFEKRHLIVTLKVKMGENLRKLQLKPWKRKFRPTLMTQMPCGELKKKVEVHEKHLQNIGRSLGHSFSCPPV
jgi:transposase-like protein